MKPAIAAYAAVALAIVFGCDRLWPIWPVHAVAALVALVIATLAGLAWVAAGRR